MTNNREVTISEFGVEAAPIFADIYAQCFTTELAQNWSERDFARLLSISGTYGVVISYESIPIGFTLVREMVDEAEIITFCILPKWCNNGYATLLLEWIIKRLQLRSFKRLFLEVNEDNKTAIRLYNKFSFRKIGRRKGYYNRSNSENSDALVMQCELDI